jgi:hypothetical protein
MDAFTFMVSLLAIGLSKSILSVNPSLLDISIDLIDKALTPVLPKLTATRFQSRRDKARKATVCKVYRECEHLVLERFSIIDTNYYPGKRFSHSGCCQFLRSIIEFISMSSYDPV